MRKRRENCLVSCSPTQGVALMDARLLEHMENDACEGRPVSERWRYVMRLARTAEQTGHLDTAQRLFWKATLLCTEPDHERLSFRHAPLAREAAECYDRIWAHLGDHSRRGRRWVKLTYDDVHYTLLNE